MSAPAAGRTRLPTATWVGLGTALLLVAIVAAAAAFGTAMAVLVVAALTMLVAITALWGSIRALLGQSPLEPEDAYALGAATAEDEQKRAVLRALQDLEDEHRLGRVDEADFALLSERYRAEAGALLGVQPVGIDALRLRVEQAIADRRPAGLARSASDEELDEAEQEELDEAEQEELDEAEQEELDEAEQEELDEAGQEELDEAGQEELDEAKEAPRKVCAECSSRNDTDAKFCKRCGRPLAALLGLVLLMLAAPAHSQPAAPDMPEGTQAPTLGPAQMDGQLPPGHPDISQMVQGGSPQVGMPGKQMGMPGKQMGMPGKGRPPRPSNVKEDPSLPEGTMDVVVLDASEKPVAGAHLVVSVLRRSKQAGVPTSDRLEADTDDRGHYRFEGLAVGDEASYWLSTSRGEAQFFIDPFGLPSGRGVRVRVRALEATSDPAETGLDVWVMIAVEVRESTLVVEHLLRVTNTGPKAWVPQGLALALPRGAGELETPEAMGGSSLRRAGEAVELVGTFSVGLTDLRYRYEVPLGTQAEQTLSLGLPPAASWIRVVTPASASFGLQVPGLGPATPGRSPEGQRILVAQQRTERPSPEPPAPARQLLVTITGLPSAGLARWIALGASLLALLWGVALAWLRRAHRNEPDLEALREARNVLLDEVVALERSHAAGAIDAGSFGPTREGLVEALVRIEQRLGTDSR